MKSRQLNNPNCLDYFKVRRRPVPAPHFAYTELNSTVYNLEHTIVKWIYRNLRGRFYVGTKYVLEADTAEKKVHIGFENPNELTFFLIACPHLKY